MIARECSEPAEGSVVRTAQRLASELAGELPLPDEVLRDPRLIEPAWPRLRRADLPIDEVAACASDLALALADPKRPDRADLAELVNDTLIALALYRDSVRARTRHRRRGRHVRTKLGEQRAVRVTADPPAEPARAAATAVAVVASDARRLESALMGDPKTSGSRPRRMTHRGRGADSSSPARTAPPRPYEEAEYP